VSPFPRSRSYNNNPILLPHIEILILICRRKSLKFYYAGKPVAKLPCYIYRHTINDIQTPFLAYIDHSELDFFRKRVLRVHRVALASLGRIDMDYDPYFVGLVIALAQAQYYSHSSNERDFPSSYTVQTYLRAFSLRPLANKNQVYLFVTNCECYGFFRAYSATITTAFLRKLDKPSVFSDSTLSIKFASIPCCPDSNLIKEFAAMLAPPREKKLPRELFVVTKPRPRKRRKILRGEGVDRETI
jgi:hypothetical protein